MSCNLLSEFFKQKGCLPVIQKKLFRNAKLFKCSLHWDARSCSDRQASSCADDDTGKCSGTDHWSYKRIVISKKSKELISVYILWDFDPNHWSGGKSYSAWVIACTFHDTVIVGDEIQWQFWKSRLWAYPHTLAGQDLCKDEAWLDSKPIVSESLFPRHNPLLASGGWSVTLDHRVCNDVRTSGHYYKVQKIFGRKSTSFRMVCHGPSFRGTAENIHDQWSITTCDHCWVQTCLLSCTVLLQGFCLYTVCSHARIISQQSLISTRLIGSHLLTD